MMARSNQLEERAAAITPMETAVIMDRISVVIISEKVGSRRCRISSVTGLREKLDTPRSPLSSPPIQA